MGCLETLKDSREQSSGEEGINDGRHVKGRGCGRGGAGPRWLGHMGFGHLLVTQATHTHTHTHTVLTEHGCCSSLTPAPRLRGPRAAPLLGQPSVPLAQARRRRQGRRGAGPRPPSPRRVGAAGPLNLSLPQSWVKLYPRSDYEALFVTCSQCPSLGDFSLLSPLPNSASPRGPGAAVSLGRCWWLQGHSS